MMTNTTHRIYTAVVGAVAVIISSQLSFTASLSITAAPATRPRLPRTKVQLVPVDSLYDYESNIAQVLNELRPYKYDPTVPAWFNNRRLSFSRYWVLSDWVQYSSRRRYLLYTFGMWKSRLLRRLMPQLSILMLWSLVACKIADFRPGMFNRLHLNLSTLSLVSTVVGAVQALRTNQGLSRLMDARLAMANSISTTRDLATLISTYIYPRDPFLGIKSARLLALFPWSVKHHVRELKSFDIDQTLLLPHHKLDYTYISQQRKKPVAIIHRLRQIMANLSTRNLIGSTEHRLIEQNLQSLGHSITTCDRLKSSPIPPIYASHAGRLLVFYLVGLPLALVGSGISSFAIIMLTLTVGFAMLGLDELSHIFELPFKYMPLYELSKVSMMDVADAFCRQPPPLVGENSDDNWIQRRSLYWRSKNDPELPYDGRDFH